MLVNLQLKLVLIVALFFAVVPHVSAHDPVTSDIYAITKYTRKTNPLLKVAEKKTTVGFIPYYMANNKTYVFLGRELKESHHEDAATYSDFGGNVKIGEGTILENGLRELKEETMGQLRLREGEVLKHGYLLFKNNETNHREIYYIFYKLSDREYAKTLKLNAMRERLKASSLPNAYLEKDHFVWVNLDDLLQQTVALEDPEQFVTVHTIDGAEVKLRIRGYFLRDCLQNPELAEIVARL